MTDPTPTQLDPENDVSFPEFKWDRYRYGNHRAVICVEDNSWAVRASFEWRRRDPNPESIDMVLVAASTGEEITNAVRLHLDRFSADILFEPIAGPGEYYFYYLPYDANPDAFYQKASYRLRQQTVNVEWAERALEQTRDLPEARLARMESVAPHHEFSSMEQPAKPSEVTALVSLVPDAGFLVFPEDRSRPIKMRTFLPVEWTNRTSHPTLTLRARPDEYLTFQLGVFAARRNLDRVQVVFRELQGSSVIPADAFDCFNQSGVDDRGVSFTKHVTIEKDHVAPLWCGLQIPENASGDYQGVVSVVADGEERFFSLKVAVEGTPIQNHGDDEPSRLSRLRWLNSRLGHESTIVPPFTPVQVSDRSIQLLGREISIGQDGLPQAIHSQTKSILSSPIRFLLTDLDGRQRSLMGEPFVFRQVGEGRVEWEYETCVEELSVGLKASIEFDGTIEYEISLTSLNDQSYRDIRLEVPFEPGANRFLMGLGQKGGACPKEFDWKWDVSKNQDAVWIGDVDRGLQLSFRDEHYRRPLNTNFYHQLPLVMPRSWCNDGHGGIQLTQGPDDTQLVAYSGPISLAMGETVRFDFRIAITPFKPINSDQHFSRRFFHGTVNLEEVEKTGANTVNVHHGTDINPYINYPFLRPAAMKKYVDEAHDRGMLLKIYYTFRELSTRAPELWALLSLDHEIFTSGPGGGYSWLSEHVGSDYMPAWYDPGKEDSSLINTGLSRWLNAYVEGLDWLARNVGIDGLYLDDIAFDRTTMKRVRRILAKHRPEPYIDLHSANQFCEKDGFSSSLNLYLEDVPFIDRLWFGEYFDYNSPPDYWLVEVSGIPFGVMGEMLEKGGNPWRGALFGMTNRLSWPPADPRPVWKIWDAFGIVESTMHGWWSSDCPVSTNHADVLATTYVKPGSSLIAIASWATEPVNVKLDIDWNALGLDQRKVRLEAIESPGFQTGRIFKPSDSIPVEVGQGWMLIAKEL